MSGKRAVSVLKEADFRNVEIWMPKMEQVEVPAGGVGHSGRSGTGYWPIQTWLSDVIVLRA